MSKPTLKTILKKAGILSVICFFVSAVIVWMLNAIIPFLNINEKEYLIKYYDQKNKSATQAALEDTTLIIVSTNSTDRAYLAHLIDKLCESDASVVSVDFRFMGRKDQSSDSLLVDVVNRHAHKLVMATAEGPNGSLKSFFEDDCSPELTFGLTNLPDYFYSATKFDSDKQLLSYETVRKVRPDLNTDRVVINFLNRDFETISGDQFLSEPDEVDLNGKIVLLGCIDEDKDTQKTPFLIEGTHWISGIYIHAYAIHSLMEDKDAFHTLPLFWEAVICALLTFVFSIMYVFFVMLMNNIRESTTGIRGKLILLAKPFAVFFAEILCYLLCYFFLTAVFHITPNILLYMISILLISGFNDAIDEKITE